MITMLWWFLVNSEGTQPHIYEYLFSPKLPSHPACHLTLSIEPNSLCYILGPYWLSILWPRLLERLHKCRWFPETNNPHFPIHCVRPVFPKCIFFGVFTKEGQEFIATPAGKWQKSSVEAGVDVTSICKAGGKVFKPSSLMAPEQRARGCRGPVNCTVMPGASSGMNMCFEFSKWVRHTTRDKCWSQADVTCVFQEGRAEGDCVLASSTLKMMDWHFMESGPLTRNMGWWVIPPQALLSFHKRNLRFKTSM